MTRSPRQDALATIGRYARAVARADAQLDDALRTGAEWGYSVRELADATGLPRETLRRRLRRLATSTERTNR